MVARTIYIAALTAVLALTLAACSDTGEQVAVPPHCGLRSDGSARSSNIYSGRYPDFRPDVRPRISGHYPYPGPSLDSRAYRDGPAGGDSRSDDGTNASYLDTYSRSRYADFYAYGHAAGRFNSRAAGYCYSDSSDAGTDRDRNTNRHSCSYGDQSS